MLSIRRFWWRLTDSRREQRPQPRGKRDLVMLLTKLRSAKELAAGGDRLLPVRAARRALKRTQFGRPRGRAASIAFTDGGGSRSRCPWPAAVAMTSLSSCPGPQVPGAGRRRWPTKTPPRHALRGLRLRHDKCRRLLCSAAPAQPSRTGPARWPMTWVGLASTYKKNFLADRSRA